jgi:hypothetical protein
VLLALFNKLVARAARRQRKAIKAQLTNILVKSVRTRYI